MAMQSLDVDMNGVVAQSQVGGDLLFAVPGQEPLQRLPQTRGKRWILGQLPRQPTGADLGADEAAKLRQHLSLAQVGGRGMGA